MNSNTKTFLLWVFIVLVAGLAFSRFHAVTQEVHEINFSRHLEEVQEGRVKEVMISGPTGQDLEGTYTDGSKFSSSKPPDYDAYYQTLSLAAEEKYTAKYSYATIRDKILQLYKT